MKEGPEGKHVTRWDMLSLLSGSAAFGAAIGVARVKGGGTFRLVVAVALGLGLGIFAIFCVRRAGRFFFRRIPASENLAETERRVRRVYFGAMAWLIVAPFLTWKVTYCVIQLIAP